jgi:hypothetical protein
MLINGGQGTDPAGVREAYAVLFRPLALGELIVLRRRVCAADATAWWLEIEREVTRRGE